MAQNESSVKPKALKASKGRGTKAPPAPLKVNISSGATSQRLKGFDVERKGLRRRLYFTRETTLRPESVRVAGHLGGAACLVTFARVCM